VTLDAQQARAKSSRINYTHASFFFCTCRDTRSAPSTSKLVSYNLHSR